MSKTKTLLERYAAEPAHERNGADAERADRSSAVEAYVSPNVYDGVRFFAPRRPLSVRPLTPRCAGGVLPERPSGLCSPRYLVG